MPSEVPVKNFKTESYLFEDFIKCCINTNSIIFSIFIFVSFFKWHEIFREHNPDYFFDMCKIDESMKDDNFCHMIFDISDANGSYVFAKYLHHREDWAEGNKTIIVERLINCYKKFFPLEACYTEKASAFLDEKMAEYYANVRTYIFVSAILLATTYYHFCKIDERIFLYTKWDKETYEFDKRCFFRHCGINMIVWFGALTFFTDLAHYNSMYLEQFWFKCNHPKPFQMSCGNGPAGKYFYSWTILISLFGFWMYRNAGKINIFYRIFYFFFPQYAMFHGISRSTN